MTKEFSWHDIEISEAFDRLGSSPDGLSETEATARLREHGPNELDQTGGINAWHMLLEQLRNPLNFVLVAAALISFFAGKTLDTVVIAIIIIFNTAMGFVQEFRAEKALQALRSMVTPEAEVLRPCEGAKGACEEIRVKAEHLVPGDVLLLEAGDKVPADARLFEAANLEVDESMLTGESLTVRKGVEVMPAGSGVADRKNLVYSGTIVTQGRARAVVYSTGMRTEIGKIAQLIGSTERAETPIQRRTKDLSKKLGAFALFTSIITLTVGFFKGFEFTEMLLFALASAVSAIPEGLLVVLTITLAIGGHRMVRRNALIRKLQAVETLGSVTTICTDKTGTLTTNQMTARRIFVGGKDISISGAGYVPEGEFASAGEKLGLAEEDLVLLLRASLLCNDSRLRLHEVDGGSKWEIAGDPTEGALVVAARKAGLLQEEENRNFPRIEEVPFDAKRRFMATFHKDKGKVLIQVKGAPETILGMCDQVQEGEKVRSMTAEDRKVIMDRSGSMAEDALRVLGVASRTIEENELKPVKQSMMDSGEKLTFLGLIGMIDPPRPEVKRAVSLCHQAGIKVIMCTGDHKKTAEAIARELGILKGGQRVVEGEELDGMDSATLDAMVLDVAVFARVSPKNKHSIVESLRRRGHIVAMTGDGVNDAPALKASNVGISMGITGTDVTKETADMVLTDDNFATIVNAVEEGRVVFENIRKVVKYLITTNTGEIITILGFLLLLAGTNGIDFLILTPIMILYINLVTDGLLDKTLAMEPGEPHIMDEPPRSPDARIITFKMVQNIFILGVTMAVGTLFLFDRAFSSLSDPQEAKAKAMTVAFVTMAAFQIWNSMNCRSRTRSVFRMKLTGNRFLLMGMASSATLLYLATELSFFQVGLGTVSLSVWDWASVFLVSSTILVVEEVRKFLQARMGGCKA
ncbi:MAG TPA: HAD-IC family P-type ATPase [Methanomassiliicoccales archaeon]|nr:HAD-IC family P-type ATPase [Methanomassiliicoccales archaeon]HPR98694.1 HAD-IC family P-type ATPase [Methanomassiliicoccales archaeon]